MRGMLEHGLDSRLMAPEASPHDSRLNEAQDALSSSSFATRRSLLNSGRVRFAMAMSICGIYLLPFMRIVLTRTDEGTFLEGADRILRGDVFARDFMEVMGPGTFYWLAGFYKVFGANVFASRICLYMSWMATALVVYRLSRIVHASYRMLPLMLIVVTCFSSLGVGVSHHIDSNWLALLTVVCLDMWRERHRTCWLLAAGVLCALTALVHQPKGALVMVAAIIWVWSQERSQGKTIRSIGAVSAGFVTVIGFAGLYFMANRALVAVVRTTCVWPFQHYGALNKVPYAYGTFTFNWRGVPLDTPSSYFIFVLGCVLIVPFLYVAVLPAIVILQSLWKRTRALSAEVSLYLLSGSALWLSELHRKDIVHLVFGSPLLIIASVQLFSQGANRLSRIALVALTASSCALATCNLMVVLTARTVFTRAGRVALFEGGDEFAALNANLSPGEEMLAYPYCPSYYFLTQAHNPTRFSVLVSGYNTPDEVLEVIRVLQSRRVRHILWDTSFRERSMPLVFPAALRAPDDLAPLEVYMRDHYLTVYSRSGFQILERRSEPSDH